MESETSPADDPEEHGTGKSFWREIINRLLKLTGREQSVNGKIENDYERGEDSNEEWQDGYNNGIDDENSGEEENYSGIDSENEEIFEGEEGEEGDNGTENKNEDNFEGELEEEGDKDIESENEENFEGEEEEEEEDDKDIESENEENFEGEEEEEEEGDKDIESENEENFEGEEEEEVDDDTESEYGTDEGKEEEEEEESDYNNDNEEVNNFESEEEEYEDEKDERTEKDEVGEEYNRIEDDSSESPEEVNEDLNDVHVQGNDDANGIPRNVIRSAVEDLWDGHPFYDFSLVDDSISPKRLMRRHAWDNGRADKKHAQDTDGIHGGRQGSELETNDVERRSVDEDDELFSYKTTLHDHYPERYIKYVIDTQIDNENNQARHLDNRLEGTDEGFLIKEAKEFNMARDLNSPDQEDSMKHRGTALEADDRGDDYGNTEAQSLENEFDTSSQSEEFGMAKDFTPHDEESFEENGGIQSNDDDQGEVNDEEDIDRVAWEPNDERFNKGSQGNFINVLNN